MSANLTPEYKAAEAAFGKARDPRERLEWLREILLSLNLGKRRFLDGPRKLAQGLLPGVQGPPRVEARPLVQGYEAAGRSSDPRSGLRTLPEGETPATPSHRSVQISALHQSRIPRFREFGNTSA